MYEFVDEDTVCPGYSYIVMEYCQCDLAHIVETRKERHKFLDGQLIKYIAKASGQFI